MDYLDFLDAKMVQAPESGFDVAPERLNSRLFDWQKVAVSWALRGGRRGLIEDCGLGKTPQQLAWADEVLRLTNKPVLIAAPLAVSKQTVREGEKFGIEVIPCRGQADVRKAVNITNYEMLGKFDPAAFAGVVLDESGILKSFTGKVKRQLCDMFQATPYRLCCTATPAPNDHMEIGNHSSFLGIMPSTEMLTRWFIHDYKAGCYRIKEHGRRDFFRWMTSWAICLSKPSDLGTGFSDDGYDLPPLNTVSHVVRCDHDFTGGTLVDLSTMSSANRAKHMRPTLLARADKVAELCAGSDEPWLIWVNLDEEAAAVLERVPGALEVSGKMKAEQKAEVLEAFQSGELKKIITKPSIAGYGLNFQHCRNMASIGLNFSFEQRYQAVRRCWRFGQEREVFDHVIMGQNEMKKNARVKAKQERHEDMQRSMAAAMREFQGEQHNLTLKDYQPGTAIRLPSFIRAA